MANFTTRTISNASISPSKAQDRRDSRRSLAESALILYFILRPVYLFPSGGLQVADVVLIGLFVYLFASFGVDRHGQEDVKIAFTAMLPYILWVITVNLITFITIDSRAASSQNHSLLISCLFPIFNLFAVMTCIMLNQLLGERFSNILEKGLVATSLVSAALVLMSSNGVARTVGGFNNPNQLGYYAVVISTIALIYSKDFSNKSLLIILVCMLYSVVKSQSKAAVVAIAALLVFVVLFEPTLETHLNKKVRALIVVLILLGVLFILSDASFFSGNQFLSTLKRRMDNMFSENDSDLFYGRGYGRITEMNGAQIVWGEGEGAYYRFSILHGKEIHSTYASTLVSYGVVGLALLFLAIYSLLFQHSHSIMVPLLLFSGIFLYWITHQGIRTSMVWILFAVWYVRCRYSWNKQEANTDPEGVAS